jgi:hypothetical protein
METAILTVAILIVIEIPLTGWLLWQSSLKLTQSSNGGILDAINECAQPILDDTSAIRSVITAASRLKSSKEQPSPFEGDKIPDKVKPTSRYVPVSTRRAQAERQSLGPATHDEKVRENNARAMETAG